MFPEVVLMNTPCHALLVEYQYLLSDSDTPCSKIKDVWSSIFNTFVKPNDGWQALWIVTEDACVKYKVLDPTAVIVTVNNCDWDNMAATVTVTGVQNDTVLPSVLEVPVSALYPIKSQDYDELDLKLIASWLDKYRYFFKHLWYPWDAKRSVSISEWCETHLEKRLQIQSDIGNNILDKRVVQYYKSLIHESKYLESSLSQVDSKTSPRCQRMNMINNCIRRKVLKMELDFFEEPELRKDLMMLSQKYGPTPENSGKEAIFVWSGDRISTLTTYLNTISSFVSDDVTLKMSSSLQEALEKSSAGNLIILPPGLHTLKSLTGLESGGVIRGLGQRDDTNLVMDQYRATRAVLLQTFGEFELYNLTVSRLEGIAIQVSEKTLKMSNCRVTSKNSTALRGIIVTSGSCLVLDNCEIIGFGIGILVQSGGKAVLTDTRIRDSVGGMKVSEESEVTLTNVDISTCSKFGLCVETTAQDITSPVSGDVDMLKDRGYRYTFDSVAFKDNKEFDVVIVGSLDHLADDVCGDISNGTIEISDDDDEDSVFGDCDTSGCSQSNTPVVTI